MLRPSPTPLARDRTTRRAAAHAVVDEPSESLASEAVHIRDQAFGDRITYSPKVFIPLTMLCRDRCGYCTFAKPPARLDAPYLTVDEVLRIARHGVATGCHEALFTLGEAPEDRYPAAGDWLADHGFDSTVDYLAYTAGVVLEETGLLPHANAGALSPADLATLRAVSPSQGMMIETLADRLGGPGGPHHGAPDKTARRRLTTLEAAGELSIPFTTGILVGIGETRSERVDALLAIDTTHERHGHVQEVIVQNFLPKPGTSMHREPPCDPEEFRWTVAAARVLLDPSIHLQAPPNLSDDPTELIRTGIDDWGGVSPVTPDHVNPERPWPAVERLDDVTRSAGKVLAPRLTVYPEFTADPTRWLDEATRFGVLVHSDAEGLARDDAWSSGGTVAPPDLLAGTPRAGGSVGEVLEDVASGRELDVHQIAVLFRARGPEVVAVAEAADELRRQGVGDAVTFVRNRNINYTNVCTFKCRFCAFSKGPLSLNLRGKPYLLDREEIQRRVLEAVECGATEVCLQGGIHPDFDGDYYRNVVRDVKAVAPAIHVHGFTALEVTEGAKRLEMPLADYLVSMRDAGLATLPGTAAEVLDDDVRAILCPDKITTEEWLDAHRTAHGVGLRSNVTLMFGHLERPVHLARHLTRTRALQKETGGFTEFVPLPFVHMASPIFLQHRARPGPTFRETLLVHAVARIAYYGWIDNIQVSWVKTGASGAAQLLRAGANDLGGTLMDENISRAAGADHGQELGEAEFRSIVEPLGRTLEQRTTLYGRASTSGHRLREPETDEPPASSVPVQIRPTPVEAFR